MPRSLAFEILSAIAEVGRAKAEAHRANHAHHAHDVEHDGSEAEDEIEFEVDDFDRIELSGPYDVEIETGGRAEVRASGPEWGLDALNVEIEDGCLSISCEGDCDGVVEITISTPKLSSLRMSGSGDVSIDDVKGDVCE